MILSNRTWRRGDEAGWLMPGLPRWARRTSPCWPGSPGSPCPPTGRSTWPGPCRGLRTGTACAAGPSWPGCASAARRCWPRCAAASSSRGSGRCPTPASSTCCGGTCCPGCSMTGPGCGSGRPAARPAVNCTGSGCCGGSARRCPAPGWWARICWPSASRRPGKGRPAPRRCLRTCGPPSAGSAAIWSGIPPRPGSSTSCCAAMSRSTCRRGRSRPCTPSWRGRCAVAACCCWAALSGCCGRSSSP